MPYIPGEKTYFPALTGIRTVAASMVFLHHFNVFKISIFGIALHGFVGEFHVGVTIFFVLSGFLICYRYDHLMQWNRKWLMDYFVNRAARVYPMYFLLTIFYSLPFICECHFRDHLPVLLLNLSFLRGFFDDYKFTLVTSGWSLTVEEMFYLLFPLLIFLSHRIRILFQMMLITGIGLALWIVFRHVDFHGFMKSLQFLFEFTFFGRWFEFLAGICLARWIRSGRLSLEVSSGMSRTASGLIWLIACIALLAVNTHYTVDKNHFLIFETAINNFLLPPGIALLFYGLMRERSLVQRILSSKPFDLLGKSSYSFYLIHNGLLFSFLFVTIGLNIAVVYLLLQLTSILLYLALEHPLNRWIRKKWQASHTFSGHSSSLLS